MDVDQITYDDIYKILKNRLFYTNNLYKNKEPDNLDQENILFFKYYFDFSSAIESCLRGIIFEYSNHELIGKCIKQFAEPQSAGKAYFLNEDVFSAIVNERNVFNNIDFNDFEHFVFELVDVVSFNFNSTRALFNDFDNTKNTYKEIRDTRNTIAHGLQSLSSNRIEYSASRLLKFIYIYFLLHNYYKNVLENATKNMANKTNTVNAELKIQ